MPDLTQVYGEHCKVEQVLVRAFGFERVFVRAGANALLRAAIDAYGVGYPVHSFGAFNCRMTTGGTSWSAHAWAAAVDINPAQNPYSSKGVLRTDMPDALVAAFTLDNHAPVLAVQRGRRWIYRPRPRFELQGGDRVISIGPEEGVGELEGLASAPAPAFDAQG